MAGKTNLKPVTIYFTEDEYQEFAAQAEDEGQSLAALVRARLKLPFLRRGAPQGNRNRTPKKATPTAARRSKVF
jgi:hypothetical protein